MISFIIPTFNEERALEKTLTSLLSYSGEHETIVSDDKSTDATVTIAKKYTDKVVVNERNEHNIAANRNRGAKLAKGEYLVFVDSDVTIPDSNRFFKKAEEVFRSKKIVALTVFNRVEPLLETTGDKIIIGFFNYFFLLLNNFLYLGASSGKFQMIRADAFWEVQGFDENLITGEDQDLFRRLSKKGRTYLLKDFSIYYSGRRAHAIGWPRLLWQWTRDTIAVLLLRRSMSREWKDVR